MEEQSRMGRKDSGEDYMAQAAPVAVIGAGASGCMAAVSAAVYMKSSAQSTSGTRKFESKGKEVSGIRVERTPRNQVLLIDANDKIGRKIYATGNGRCNITNLHMDENCYHVGGGEDLSAFFARFSVDDHMRFWKRNGILLHDRQGYVYPGTDQASTIAEAFEKILRKLQVKVVLGERAAQIDALRTKGGMIYRIGTDKGSQYFARKVILAGGGAAGPQYGCSGDMYRMARQLGHSVTKPLPALVQLTCEEKTVKAAAGVRCSAAIRLLSGSSVLGTERGELQITDKGISGIPVFQLSGGAARALDRGEKVRAVIDFLPDLTETEWVYEKERRMAENRNCMLSEFFLGLVNRKVLDMVLRAAGLQAEKKAAKLTDRELNAVMDDLRAFAFTVSGTGTFGQAQVTSGGVPLSELDENLQSLRSPGLYMAGELLDVDGICGGYNLQWAMTSGWIAGESAAQ